jgi:hypothetical protein
MVSPRLTSPEFGDLLSFLGFAHIHTFRLRDAKDSLKQNRRRTHVMPARFMCDCGCGSLPQHFDIWPLSSNGIQMKQRSLKSMNDPRGSVCLDHHPPPLLNAVNLLRQYGNGGQFWASAAPINEAERPSPDRSLTIGFCATFCRVRPGRILCVGALL